MIIECKTQAELTEALKSPKAEIRLVGGGYFEICGSSQVRACGSSQVRAYGSSQVRACDSSQVTAYGSSQVTAYGSSQVTAYGSSQVTACDSSQVTAGNYVAVTIHGKNVKVTGGVKIVLPPIKTAEDWCEFYGVEVNDGAAILFKALNDDFTSPHGTAYKPGEDVEAPDWDGGEAECGGGLHFSPRAFMELRFHDTAKRFTACSVPLKTMAVHPDGNYPDKCKAKSCHVLYECDQDGKAKK